MRKFPSETIPEGWYQVGWSSEFERGKSYPLSYFGQELVCFRTQSGRLSVLDAYCRHMGAHLGHGGIVEAEAIRCPFHGWLFDAGGQNLEIPYSSPCRMENLRLKHWEVREVDGLALVWFSETGTGPTWEPEPWIPPDEDLWPTYPNTTRTWSSLELAPQMVVDNAADAAHFRYVHTAHSIPIVERHSAEGVTFRVELEYSYGEGQEQTWATPNGPVNGTLTTQCRGLGFIYSRLSGFDTIYNILAVTPVTATTADLRATNYIRKRRGDDSPMSPDIRDKWVRQQHNQVHADTVIWGTMSYTKMPAFAQAEVGPLGAFRKWSRQFYTDR
jgi:3-ketosteroid 9alpha-monooxygenase subunit A